MELSCSGADGDEQFPSHSASATIFYCSVFLPQILETPNQTSHPGCFSPSDQRNPRPLESRVSFLRFHIIRICTCQWDKNIHSHFRVQMFFLIPNMDKTSLFGGEGAEPRSVPSTSPHLLTPENEITNISSRKSFLCRAQPQLQGGGGFKVVSASNHWRFTRTPNWEETKGRPRSQCPIRPGTCRIPQEELDVWNILLNSELQPWTSRRRWMDINRFQWECRSASWCHCLKRRGLSLAHVSSSRVTLLSHMFLSAC